MSITPVTYRPATPFDAPRIAELHARSWQENYRGDMSDDYLDHEAPAERLAVWTGRFSEENDAMRVMLAEDGKSLVGFCCLMLDQGRQDGALLDNLHVHAGYRDHGIGKRLMHWAAGEVMQYDPGSGLYLWVLDSNTAARAVYEHLGGSPGRSERQHMSGTDPGGVGATAIHFDPRDLQRRTGS